jgi:hypothetical protein
VNTNHQNIFVDVENVTGSELTSGDHGGFIWIDVARHNRLKGYDKMGAGNNAIDSLIRSRPMPSPSVDDQFELKFYATVG